MTSRDAAKDFRQAIHLYSEAIALNPHDAIFVRPNTSLCPVRGAVLMEA